MSKYFIGHHDMGQWGSEGQSDGRNHIQKNKNKTKQIGLVS